jgi:voltage-gated potassium channel
VLGLTTIVTLIGASGIYVFERELPNGAIADYGTALCWTAMVMITIGSDFFPKTAEGRVLFFLLAMYAFGVSGYVTAMLATFFVGQDAENDESELAGTKSINALQAEISALRTEIQILAKRGLDP